MRFNFFNKNNPIDESPMGSKQEFFNVIYDYYPKRVDAEISPEFLTGVSERIADFYYEQYSRFRLQSLNL
jgi:hypothetical protein